MIINTDGTRLSLDQNMIWPAVYVCYIVHKSQQNQMVNVVQYNVTIW